MPDGGSGSSRAERRRREREQRRRGDGLRQFTDHTGGAMTLHLIRAELAFVMCLVDTRDARIFQRLVANFVANLSAGQDCLLCGRAFSIDEPPIDWTVLLPLREDPSIALLSGICADCSGAHRADTEALRAAEAAIGECGPRCGGSMRYTRPTRGAGHDRRRGTVPSGRRAPGSDGPTRGPVDRRRPALPIRRAD